MEVFPRVLRVLQISYYEEEELGDRPRAHRVVLGLRASLLPRSGSREVDSGPVNPPETPEVAQWV